MLNKISVKVENAGISKIIRKQFTRNSQHISTTSAYSDNKLYYRNWTIDKKRSITKCYHNGKTISCSKLNLEV
jgi:hypothetical protein